MAQDKPATLDDSDDSDGVRPPSVTKRKPVLLPETTRQVGSLVWDHNRRWNAYLSTRSHTQNRLRIHNAYPISLPLVARLQAFEVERVLIPVRDDEDYGHGTVYEFDLSAYLPENSPVYEWDKDDGVDKQTCPHKDEDSVHIWPSLGSDLFETR